MQNRYVAIGVFMLGTIVPNVFGESLKVETPRGDVLDVISDIPDGKGPYPAVVLGPGTNYPMALPALEQPTQQLLERRFQVTR